MPDFCKIPINVPTHDKALVKLLATYYALKQFRYNGLLYNFKANRSFYAEALNISVSKLRYMESALVRKDLANWNGKHLQLVSYEKSHAVIDTPYLGKFVKFQSTDVHFLEKAIYALAIRKNLKQQQYQVKKKIVFYEAMNLKTCRDIGTNPISSLVGADFDLLVKKASQRRTENAFKKLAKWVMNQDKGKTLDRYEIATYKHLGATVEFPAINTICTLSCSGVARVALGKHVKSTGYYLEQWLKFYGLFTIQGDQVPINTNLKSESSFFERCGVGHRTRILRNRVTPQF